MRKGKAWIREDRITLGYARCSTLEQVDATSISAQVAKLQAYAALSGRRIADIVVDGGISGRSIDRPGMSSILERVKRREIEAVIITKLDRLTRSIKDLCDLVELFAKTDTALISTTESIDTSSASGRLVLHVLGVLGEFEREQIAERTSTALAHLRENRKPYGHPPFGFQRQGDALIAIPQELRALHQIRRMRQDGCTLRGIGRWLEDSGLTPRQGGRCWHPSAVRHVLLSSALTDDELRVELEALDRAGYKAGDVVRQRFSGGDDRLVRVTDRLPDVNDGRPGFDGIELCPELKQRTEGDAVWGYDDQIVEVIRSA